MSNAVSLPLFCRALNVPTSDYSYNDCKLMSKARQLNIPHVTEIVEIQRLRQHIGCVYLLLYDKN